MHQQLRKKRASIVLLMAGVAALIGSAVAFAGIFVYSGGGSLAPGGYYATSAETFREHNRACRDGNSGQMSVGYYVSGSRVSYSGVQYTNCPDAVVGLENDGTYQSRCTNEGTVTFPVVCQTTRP